MAAADPNAGVIYVCNPNNPTGSLTPKDEIEYLVANKPKGAIVLLDEAYIHLSKTAEPGSPMVAADKDVIILRTFSKLYGMAGLRAGAAMGRPDLLAKIRGYGAGALPVTGMVGATASLKAKDLVETAAQDHRRHPRGDRRVAGEEGVRRDPLGGEHDHDRRPPAGPRGLRGHDPGEGRDRPELAVAAEACPCHDRDARRRWRSSGPRSGAS